MQRDLLLDRCLHHESTDAGPAPVHHALADGELLLGKLDHAVIRSGSAGRGSHCGRGCRNWLASGGGLRKPVAVRPLVDVDWVLGLQDLHNLVHMLIGHPHGHDG